MYSLPKLYDSLDTQYSIEPDESQFNKEFILLKFKAIYSLFVLVIDDNMRPWEV